MEKENGEWRTENRMENEECGMGNGESLKYVIFQSGNL